MRVSEEQHDALGGDRQLDLVEVEVVTSSCMRLRRSISEAPKKREPQRGAPRRVRPGFVHFLEGRWLFLTQNEKLRWLGGHNSLPCRRERATRSIDNDWLLL